MFWNKKKKSGDEVSLKESEEKDLSEQSKNSSFSLSASINKELNDQFLKIEIEDISDEAAYQVAGLLYSLCSGRYIEVIGELFASWGTESDTFSKKDKNEFTAKIWAYWDEALRIDADETIKNMILSDDGNIEEVPIVSPESVFKGGIE